MAKITSSPVKDNTFFNLKECAVDISPKKDHLIKNKIHHHNDGTFWTR